MDAGSISVAVSEPPFRIRRTLTSEQLHFVYFASPFLTIAGLGLNVFVALGLVRTSTIKKPTSILMFTQMIINLIAITCQGVGAPALVYAGTYGTTDTGISRFIASVAVFCTYASLTMLIWITINRCVFIWHPLRAEQVFTYNLAVISCCTCVSVGAIVAMSTIFDCCYAGYSSTSMTFTFVGPQSIGQYVFAWTYISFILSTSVIAYALLLWKIRRTKRALAHHHTAQRRILFGMETRLCVGFGIVAMAWFVHLTTIIVPVVAFRYRHPAMSVFYSCSRWTLFLVDPLVYLLLTQDLRWATRKCLHEFLDKMLWCWRTKPVGGQYFETTRKMPTTVDTRGRVAVEELETCLRSASEINDSSSSV